MTRRVTTIVVVLLGLAAAAARAGDRLSRPYVLHLPGISGPMRIDRNMTAGLADVIPDATIQTYDWTGKSPGLDALLARARNEEQGKAVAKLIEEKYREDPKRPIHLSAHSGGTGIVVWALEALPEDVRVDTVLLMCSALSPEYDLSRALRRVDGKVYAFTSTLDAAVLGLGTRTFGTIDGVKSDAAGRVGFAMPAGADAREYAKLVAMPYDERWMELGNLGDHIGPMNRRFARAILAPLLLHQKPAELPATAVKPRATSGPVAATQPVLRSE